MIFLLYCSQKRNLRDNELRRLLKDSLLYDFLLCVCLYMRLNAIYQIENEYGNIEGSFGQKGKEYVKWAANMALGLGAGVPWVMCRQTDAPGEIVRSYLVYIF